MVKVENFGNYKMKCWIAFQSSGWKFAAKFQISFSNLEYLALTSEAIGSIITIKGVMCLDTRTSYMNNFLSSSKFVNGSTFVLKFAPNISKIETSR